MSGPAARLAALRPSPRARRVVTVLSALVVALFIGAFLVGNRAEIVRGLRAIGWDDVALALVAALLGLVAAMLSWRAILHGMGSRLPVPAAARVYFLSQLGKYVPGSVWPIAAQAQLAREHAVPAARSAFAALAQLLVSVVVGVAVGATLLATSQPDAIRSYWWLLPAGVAGVVALVPAVFNRLLRTGLRVTRRPGEFVAVPARALAGSAAWCLAMWLAFGLQLALLLRGPAGTGLADVALAATGAYALAWVVGFLVVVLPAGAGAREAALVFALASVVAAEPALAVALVSRVVMLAADLAGAGAAVLVARRRPGLSGGTGSP